MVTHLEELKKQGLKPQEDQGSHQVSFQLGFYFAVTLKVMKYQFLSYRDILNPTQQSAQLIYVRRLNTEKRQ